MRRILGLTAPDTTLEAWAKVFVFQHEPLFLDASTHASVPFLPVHSRAEFGAWSRTQPLEYLDAYQPWRVPTEASLVTLIQPAQLTDLTLRQRQVINQAQIQFSRGLVFPLEVALRFGWPERFLERDAVADQVLLRLDAWNALSPQAQFDWLEWFVSSDGLPSLESNHWLCGFSAVSGPNCFSTALASIHPDPSLAQAIANEWLKQDAFFAETRRRGYSAPTPWDERVLPPQSVVLFRAQDGVFVHAAASLGHGLVVNKDAQSWHRPRQVLSLLDLLERWQDDDLKLYCMNPPNHS